MDLAGLKEKISLQPWLGVDCDYGISPETKERPETRQGSTYRDYIYSDSKLQVLVLLPEAANFLESVAGLIPLLEPTESLLSRR